MRILKPLLDAIAIIRHLVLFLSHFVSFVSKPFIDHKNKKRLIKTILIEYMYLNINYH